jgi:vacuolar protein sorting-associated protein 26A/B
MATFFKPVCDIEIRLDGEDARDMVEFKTGTKDRKDKAPLYKDGESVKGTVIVRPKDGKKLEHTGIKVNLIGSIGMGLLLILVMAEMYYDRGAHYEFVSLLQELAAPGEMRNNQSFEFEFKNVEKQYESYHGINVKLRYSLWIPNLIQVISSG